MLIETAPTKVLGKEVQHLDPTTIDMVAERRIIIIISARTDGIKRLMVKFLLLLKNAWKKQRKSRTESWLNKILKWKLLQPK